MERTGNDLTLDLRGMRCPQLVLRASKAMKQIAVGGKLVLTCTDPLSRIDVPLFAQQAGHQLVCQRCVDDVLIFELVRMR